MIGDSAVQCSAVTYSVVQCSAVTYSVVQYSAVTYSVVQCSAVTYSVVQCSTVHLLKGALIVGLFPLQEGGVLHNVGFSVDFLCPQT